MQLQAKLCYNRPMRFFNTEGPVNAQYHYCLPPLKRLHLPEVMSLIERHKYFVLHAPRQTGKTTCLLALMTHLNQSGQYRALYINVESGQTSRDNVQAAMQVILSELTAGIRRAFNDASLQQRQEKLLTEVGPHGALNQMLTEWAEASPKPAVLLIDEIDALIGDSLVSVLRQLRAGYHRRPTTFPQSIILCGLRDIQDYRLQAAQTTDPLTAGSPFNIVAKSLRLGDFTADDIAALYQQYTADTSQRFAPEALALVWELTRGQPWLVNALAQQVCFESPAEPNRAQPITPAHIQQAKETLIAQRSTHVRNLTERLRDPRVRAVIEPMLAGATLGNVPPADRDYVVDLGLARRELGGGLVMANPIYREIIPRALASDPQDSLPHIKPTWLKPDGALDAERLLQAFLVFWRQHGQPLLKAAHYHEVAPHLVLMAFLHRVVNGGGTLEREYAIGSRRMDLCLRYGAVTLGIELKVWRDDESDPLTEGLEQLDEYLGGLGLDSGWLVIFDQRSGQPPISQRTRTETHTSPQGRHIVVIRG